MVGWVRAVRLSFGRDLGTPHFLARPFGPLDHSRHLIPFLIRQPNDLLLVHAELPCRPHHLPFQGTRQPEFLAVTER